MLKHSSRRPHYVAGLFALALCATPATAANVSGWYAGIYAGVANANDVEMRADAYAAQLFGPGTIETPTSYVNDGGIDPDFFDFLNLGPEEYAFADFGYASALLTTGTLDLLATGTLGAVVGYGLGNGVRIEGDLSTASFVSGDFSGTSAFFQDADGAVDLSGVWTWVHSGEDPDPVTPPASLEDDFGLSYQSSVQFLLVSGYYDIDTGTALTPYLGAGAGLARITTDCLCATPAQTQIALAAQLGGGVRIALSGPVSLDIGYRYKVAAGADVHAADTSFDGFGGYEGVAFHSAGVMGVHTLQAGVTFALQ